MEKIKFKWTYQEARDVWGVGRVEPGDIIEIDEKLCKQLTYQGFGKQIKEKKTEKKSEKVSEDIKDKGGK